MVVDAHAPTLSSAARNSDTQITVTMSEDVVDPTATNTGGFTVTETGGVATYTVSAIADGASAELVVLTVADMSASIAAGVTVTYTAGGEGLIEDTAGNLLETDATGVTVAAWETTAPTLDSIVISPESCDLIVDGSRTFTAVCYNGTTVIDCPTLTWNSSNTYPLQIDW